MVFIKMKLVATGITTGRSQTC